MKKDYFDAMLAG